MDHDGQEYDQQRARFEYLWQALNNHPTRLTDAWLQAQPDRRLCDFQILWELSHNLFSNQTDGRRSERARAEIQRRMLYCQKVHNVRRLDVLQGRRDD